MRWRVTLVAEVEPEQCVEHEIAGGQLVESRTHSSRRTVRRRECQG